MESAMQRDVYNKSLKMVCKKDIKAYLYYRQLKQHCDKWYLCFLVSLLYIAWGSDGHAHEIYGKPFLLQSHALVN